MRVMNLLSKESCLCFIFDVKGLKSCVIYVNFTVLISLLSNVLERPGQLLRVWMMHLMSAAFCCALLEELRTRRESLLLGIISYGGKADPVSERKGSCSSHARFLKRKHTFAVGV